MLWCRGLLQLIDQTLLGLSESSVDWSNYQMSVSKNNGTPKSSIPIRFSITNHPFWGTPIFGNIQITKRMVNSLTTAGCFHDLPFLIHVGGSVFFQSQEPLFLGDVHDFDSHETCKISSKKMSKKNPLKQQAIQKFIQAICSLTRPRNSKEWIRSSIAVRCPASEKPFDPMGSPVVV